MMAPKPASTSSSKASTLSQRLSPCGAAGDLGRAGARGGHGRSPERRRHDRRWPRGLRGRRLRGRGLRRRRRLPGNELLLPHVEHPRHDHRGRRHDRRSRGGRRLRNRWPHRWFRVGRRRRSVAILATGNRAHRPERMREPSWTTQEPRGPTWAIGRTCAHLDRCGSGAPGRPLRIPLRQIASAAMRGSLRATLRTGSLWLKSVADPTSVLSDPTKNCP